MKVWNDKKRACMCTDAPMVLARHMQIPTEEAARRLVEACAEDFSAAGVESLEYWEPRRGILWKAIIT